MTMWFDVLPLHPPPLPLESFTGYLVRLAQLNQLNTKTALTALTHPRRKWKNTWSDYPLQDFGNLCVATQCSERQLQATTFYHLVRKFGRGLIAHHCSRFLLTSLSSHLRYCPHCLEQKGYYSLLWRFRDLQGCLEHGCHLLDCCGHCGSHLPLISSPLRVGICPACHHDLRRSRSLQLSPQEQTITERRVVDLTYLLMPQEWEASGTFIQVVGQYLMQLRHGLGWSPLDMADKLGISRDTLASMETFKRFGRGSTLRHHFQYMDLVGLSFQEAISITQDPQAYRRLKVQQLIKAIQAVIAEFEVNQKVVTQADICLALGTVPHFIRQYPEVRTLLDEVIASRKEQHNRIMVKRVQDAIGQLLAKRQQPSISNVCKHMSVSRGALQRVPEAYALLLPYAPPRRKARQEQIMALVKQAIEELHIDSDLPTQEDIARYVQLSLHTLRYYLPVRVLLKPYPRTIARRKTLPKQ
jgi:hypothetical protein